MYQANLDKRSLRSALLLGAASVAAVSLSLPASAQDQSTETVVVTGSRIPQQGLYAPSPVTAVGQQEMKFEGTTGVETLLNNLPSVFADQTSGVSNGSTGTATVNLRDLGAVRTLVLVNGTRLMPGDPKAPVADLNQIPAALVDHVEVLTGGASAVYGSDALAGVVNFVMRKDFEGIEVDGQYGVAQADNTSAYYRGLVTTLGLPDGERRHLGRPERHRHADHGHQHRRTAKATSRPMSRIRTRQRFWPARATSRPVRSAERRTTPAPVRATTHASTRSTIRRPPTRIRSRSNLRARLRRPRSRSPLCQVPLRRTTSSTRVRATPAAARSFPIRAPTIRSSTTVRSTICSAPTRAMPAASSRITK